MWRIFSLSFYFSECEARIGIQLSCNYPKTKKRLKPLSVKGYSRFYLTRFFRKSSKFVNLLLFLRFSRRDFQKIKAQWSPSLYRMRRSWRWCLRIERIIYISPHFLYSSSIHGDLYAIYLSISSGKSSAAFSLTRLYSRADSG